MSWFSKSEENRRNLRDWKLACDRVGYSPKGIYKDDRGVYRRAYPYSTNHDNIKKFFQKISNRTVRRKLGNEEILNRGGHKKIFDLWWKVY